MDTDNTAIETTEETEELPNEDEVTETDPVEEDNPWTDPNKAKSEIEKLRRENAAKRVKMKELQESLEQASALATTKEELEQAVNEYKSKVTELETSILRADVARRYNLPDALVERLQGDTAEELEADAKALASLVKTPSEPARLKGGLNPRQESDPDAGKTPRELGAALRAKRR